MADDAELVIAGGGLNGMLLAVACAGAGLSTLVIDRQDPAAMMADASLIIIGPNSSMFNGNHPAPDLKTTLIPVMISKDGHTDEVGLGTVQNTDAHFNTIDIIKTDHPLAAGLTCRAQ